MNWFKNKRKPCKVVVHFDDLAGEEKFRGGHKFERKIIIPDGHTFKYGFAQHPRLLNRNGEIVWIYNWKAGYEVTYEFLYD